MSYLNSILDSNQGIRPGLSSLDNRKFWLPAAITAMGLIGSAVLNKKSNDANNERQLQLVREQNEYNTPANQVSRFRDAGLNPYLMLGQVNSGNQQSVASTQATDYSQFAQAGVQVGGLVQQMLVNRANIANINADTRLKQIQGDTQRELANAQISNLLAGASVDSANAGYIGSQHRFYNDSYADRLLQNRYSAESIYAGLQQSQAQTRLLGINADRENFAYNLDKLYGEQLKRSELRAADAAYKLSMSNIDVNNSQRVVYANQAKLYRNEAYGQGLENQMSSNDVVWHGKRNALDYSEMLRQHKYNNSFYRSPINDRNWKRAGSIIPFASGYSSEARAWSSGHSRPSRFFK